MTGRHSSLPATRSEWAAEALPTTRSEWTAEALLLFVEARRLLLTGSLVEASAHAQVAQAAAGIAALIPAPAPRPVSLEAVS